MRKIVNHDQVNNFLRYLILHGVSKKSIKFYKSDLINFLFWANDRKLDNNLIKEFVSSQVKITPPSTINRRLSTLRAYSQFLDKNFMLGIENLSKTQVLKNNLGKILKSSPYRLMQERIISKFEARPRLQGLFQKIFFNRPNWYKTYHTYPVANYIHIAILVLFCAVSGFAFYDQVINTAKLSLAYPSTPVAPNKYLSFQGRLTNNLGNPITTARDITFKLYTASSGGTTLWDSTACSITPDSDGIFSTLLGSTCGGAIASSVFSENASVWVGVTVGADAEATPRIQIATVAYALNSETLQGFPAGTGVSTIPYLNSSGELVIAAASPKIQSTSGTFAVEGVALTLTTPNTSNGIITINPDGTGTLDLTFEGAAAGGSANGFVNATNANITSGALYGGTVASAATGYNFIDFKSGVSPTSKFSVNNAGNVTAAGDLTISGDDLYMTTNTANYFLMADGTNYNPTSPADARTGLGLAAGGTGDIWVEKAGDTMTGPLTIDGSTDAVQLTVQANGTQTANLTEWQNSSGTLKAGIDANGHLGLGVAPDASTLLKMGGTTTSGTYQYGQDIQNTFGVDATSGAIGWRITPMTANSGGAVTIAYYKGININQLALGTNVSLTSQYGIQIGDMTNASSDYAIQTNAGNIVFNEGGDASTDLRVEGDTDANLLFVDASSDNVGIGVVDPDTQLEIFHAGNQLKLSFDATDNTTFGVDTDGNLTIDASGTKTIVADDLQITGGNITSALTMDSTLTVTGTSTLNGLTTVNDDLTVALTGNENVEITDGATPTTDTLSIVANGATVTADANALEIDFTTGDGANVTNSGLQIDLASGGTAAGDIIYGINLSMDAADASTQTAINVGANFDTGIAFGDVTKEIVLENLEAIHGQTADTITFEDDDGTDYATLTQAALTLTGDLNVNGDNITADGVLVVDGAGLTLQTTGAGTDITIDATDQVILTDFASCTALETIAGVLTCGSDAGGATAWDDIGDPDAAADIAFAEYAQTMSWNTAASSAAFDGLKLQMTNDAGTDGGTQQLFVLNNVDDAGSTGTTEALMVLVNNDANEAVTDGILFGAGGAGTDFTDGIDFSAANLTREIVLENGEAIIGQTADTITFEDDDGTDYATLTGTALTVAGDLAITGGNITSALTMDSTLTVTGLTTINDDLTVALTGNENVEITDGATPTTDTLSIVANGATVTADANALEIDFTTGDGANVTNSGLQIDLASGGTAAGDIINGINLTMDAADASTQTAINVGANFDTGIAFGDVTKEIVLENAETIDNQTDGTIALSGILTVNGTSGSGIDITNTGITNDIVLQNDETIDNNTDGTITLTATNTSLSGNLKLGGKNILDSAGVTMASFATNPAALNNYNLLTYGSWLIDNPTNDGMAALMVNQQKGGDIFTATSSADTKFTITNSGVLTLDNGETIENSTNDVIKLTTASTELTGDLTVTGSDITLGAAGVKLTGDGDGAITLLGLGNGFDEDLTLNLDDTENVGTFSSSTALASLVFSSISLTASDFVCTNCLDFTELDNSLDLDAATTITAGDNGLNLTYNKTFDNTSENGFIMSFTGADTAGTNEQIGLILNNVASGEAVDQLFTLVNNDSDDTVTYGINFSAGGGTGVDFTYGINFYNTNLDIGTAEIVLENGAHIKGQESGITTITGDVRVGGNTIWGNDNVDTVFGLMSYHHVSLHLDDDADDTNSGFYVYNGANGILLGVTESATADFNTSLTVNLDEGTATEAVCSDATDAAGGGVNSLIYDCSGTPVADYMEMYSTEPGTEPGDILVLGTENIITKDGDRITKLVKSSSVYQNSVIGIASNPDNAGDFNSIGYNIKEEDNPMPVALNGRVPVKISANSEAINVGDPITSSSDFGKGMKSLAEGRIVGTALESWDPTNPTDKIMVFVNNIYYDPTLALNNIGELDLDTSSDIAFVTDKRTNTIVDKIGAFKDLVASRIKTGRVETNMISPITNSDLVIDLEPDGSTEASRLVIRGENDSEVASIDATGKVTADSLEVESDATVAGTLYADRIESTKLSEIESLLKEVESNQDILAQSTSWEVNTATDSGDLLATTIQTKDLFVTGQAAMTSLFVSDSLATKSVNSLDSVLGIQSLAAMPVEIMAGKIKIDTNGNVLFSGNVEVAGDLTVNNLVVANSDPNATESGQINSGEITTNAIAGKAVLSAGQTEIKINNPKLKTEGLIYVTPVSSTQNKVLYVKSKDVGIFTVGFSEAIDTDCEFNWWIIDLKSGNI